MYIYIYIYICDVYLNVAASFYYADRNLGVLGICKISQKILERKYYYSMQLLYYIILYYIIYIYIYLFI